MARLLGRLLASGRGLQLRAGRQALGRATARYLLSSTQYPVLEHCASIVKGDQAGRVTGDPSAYTLQVYTGDRRSASTKAQVRARLIGTDGTAGPFTLTGDFYRATLQSFFVETPTPIGRLLHVEIGHDATDIGSGWFVDKVVVECHASGLVSEFPCESWLGESDSGGASGPLSMVLHEKESAVHRRKAAEWQTSSRELQCAAAGSCLPRTDKVRRGQRSRITAHLGWGGEDAYFISGGGRAGQPRYKRGGRAGQPETLHWALGVADGVGSWEEQGIDAGKYSRSLIEAALAHFDQFGDGPRPTREPGELSVVEEVVQRASSVTADAGIQGSSTLCVVHLDGHSATLAAANIGDSGFMLIRGGKVAYRSAQQEHSFGCPFQLGHHEAASPATDAQVCRIPVEPGDTVVLGSDGLFDNLSDADIADEATGMISQFAQEGKNRDKAMARKLANNLVERALTASLSRSRDTPFSKAATEELGLVYRGGKQDDITVVVGLFNEAVRVGLPP